jgi:hypothetical protein
MVVMLFAIPEIIELITLYKDDEIIGILYGIYLLTIRDPRAKICTILDFFYNEAFNEYAALLDFYNISNGCHKNIYNGSYDLIVHIIVLQRLYELDEDRVVELFGHQYIECMCRCARCNSYIAIKITFKYLRRLKK